MKLIAQHKDWLPAYNHNRRISYARVLQLAFFVNRPPNSFPTVNNYMDNLQTRGYVGQYYTGMSRWEAEQIRQPGDWW
jgi:hypothetical protein